MSENWDEHAKNWEQDERARRYADQAFVSLIKHVNVRDQEWQSKRILDFGCGTGLLTEKLAPLVREVIAVDISAKMIDVLRRKAIRNVTAICTDLDDHAVRYSAPWFSDFDLIVASSVCGFLPSYEFTIGVLSKTLSATGIFVQWDWLSPSNDGVGLTADRISIAFTSTGLKCVHVGRAFTMTFDDEEMHVLMGVTSAT